MANYHDHRDDYLSLQTNVICPLLFLVGVATIFQHLSDPAWFRLASAQKKSPAKYAQGQVRIDRPNDGNDLEGAARQH